MTYAINLVCQHMYSPSFIHMHDVKHTLRYIKGTINFGIRLLYQSSLIFMGFLMLTRQVIPTYQQRSTVRSSDPTMYLKVLKSIPQ